jgi:hypothetical protein
MARGNISARPKSKQRIGPIFSIRFHRYSDCPFVRQSTAHHHGVTIQVLRHVNSQDSCSEVAEYIRENCAGGAGAGGKKSGSSTFSPKVAFNLKAVTAPKVKPAKARPKDPVLRDAVIGGRGKRARVASTKFGSADGNAAKKGKGGTGGYKRVWRPSGHAHIGKRIARKYENLGGDLLWGVITKWYVGALH